MLTLESQVFLLPIIMSNKLVGQVAFIPGTLYLRSTVVNKRAPPPLKAGNSLVCTILKHTLSGDNIANQPDNKEAAVKRLPKGDPILALKDPKAAVRLEPLRNSLHHAVRKVHFPASLFKYLSDGRNRPYTIWAGQSHGTWDADTRNLQTVLDIAGIKKAALNDSRIVFIHVSALETIHTMSGYSDRRGSKLWVYFYTYGTSPKVDSSLWGVREIWTCGEFLHKDTPCRLIVSYLTSLRV